jgi:hypothetical protein
LREEALGLLQVQEATQILLRMWRLKHGLNGCLVEAMEVANEKPYGVWLRADSSSQLVGGFSDGKPLQTVTPKGPSSGAGMEQSKGGVKQTEPGLTKTILETSKTRFDSKISRGPVAVFETLGDYCLGVAQKWGEIGKK